MRSFGCPLNRGEVAGAIDNSDDLSALVGHAVKRHPPLDDNRASVRVDFRPGAAEMRMIDEQRACLLDCVIESIGNRF